MNPNCQPFLSQFSPSSTTSSSSTSSSTWKKQNAHKKHSNDSLVKNPNKYNANNTNCNSNSNNNGSSRKKSTNNGMRRDKQQKSGHIDIIIYTTDINSFQQMVHTSNQREHNNNDNNNSSSIPMEKIIQFANNMKCLGNEIRNKIGYIQQQQGNVNVDEALHKMFQGVDILDWYWYHKRKGDIIEANKKWDGSNFISSLWNNIHYIIQEVSNKIGGGGKTKKTSIFGYIRDCFNIVLKRIMLLLEFPIDDDEYQYSPSNRKKDVLNLFQSKIGVQKIQLLCKLLKSMTSGFGYDLHGENDIGRMVGNVLVPLMEVDLLRLTGSNKEDIMDIQSTSMECILVVFKWKQHSSAILAPLVVDVRSSGEERTRPNPLRVRLIRSMIALLDSEEFIEKEHSAFLCCTCECLFRSLDIVYAIDLSQKNKKKGKGKEICNSNIDHLEAANIFKWVHKRLQHSDDHDAIIISEKRQSYNNHSVRWYYLRLLTSVIKLYPQSCAQYWPLFFPQSSTLPSPTHTSFTTNVTLVSIIGDVIIPLPTLEEKIVAIKASREFLVALPLQLWCRSGYLMNRVESSLWQVIISATAQLKIMKSSECIDELCYLARSIITKIPFDVYSKLMEPAADLLNEVGECYIRNEHSGGDNLSSALQVLADCMGGVETPNGTLTPLPLPSKAWLQRPLSSRFIDCVFQMILSIESKLVSTKGSIAMLKLDLITCMVRSVSWIVIENGERLQNFVSLCHIFIASDNASLRLTGVKLICAFLEGKRSIVRTATSHNNIRSVSMSSIYHCLFPMLQEKDSILRTSALTAYGYFKYSDWILLLFHNPSPLEYILPMCLEYSGDPDGGVRAEACRALGNIITECLESMGQQNHDDLTVKLYDVAVDTIMVTASAVEDSTAGVRSMALFAMGNIAFAITKMKSLSELLHKLQLVRLSEVAYKHIFDENDKVVGNAIRTLGHLCDILYNCDYKRTLRSCDKLASIKLCGEAALELGSVIGLAIFDVTDTSSNQRSWRQRNHAKRNAWGACNALSSILCSDVAREKVNHEGVKTALVQMIKCVQHAQSLNDKITTGAVSTLSLVPIDTYGYHSDNQSISGLCIASCLINLETVGSSFKKLISELMRHHLQSPTQRDILTCLNHADLSIGSIQYLYGWMVANNIDAVCFECVGETLKLSHYSSDVSLIQKFKSRAERKRRDENAATLFHTVRSHHDDDDDSDEDEL